MALHFVKLFAELPRKVATDEGQRLRLFELPHRTILFNRSRSWALYDSRSRILYILIINAYIYSNSEQYKNVKTNRKCKSSSLDKCGLEEAATFKRDPFSFDSRITFVINFRILSWFATFSFLSAKCSSRSDR